MQQIEERQILSIMGETQNIEQIARRVLEIVPNVIIFKGYGNIYERWTKLRGMDLVRKPLPKLRTAGLHSAHLAIIEHNKVIDITVLWGDIVPPSVVQIETTTHEHIISGPH